MDKRTIIGLVALILIIGAIVWFVNWDEKEKATPVLSVSASTTTAVPGDSVVFTLNAKIQMETISGYVMEANISDVTNQASLVEASGASYNSATNSLVWTPRDIPPHESISQTFSVKVNALPSGSTSTTMTISFNNELAVEIRPTAVISGGSAMQQVASNYIAPTSGASEFVPVLLAALLTAGFIFRRRLVGITSGN